MKRIFTLLFISIFSAFYFSQSITIQWEGSTVIDYGSSKISVPFFNNEGFVYENGSVYLRLVQKHSGTDQKIRNLVWEKTAKKDLFDVQNDALPTKDHYEVSVYTNPYTQEKSSHMRVGALKVVQGIFYRLVSFSIIGAEKSRVNNGVSSGVNNGEKSTPDNNVARTIGSSENPLKAGVFYKIKVDQSGVFKITTKFLRDNGMNPANINPKNFRIYGNGGLMLPEHNLDTRYSALQENAIQVFGEEDGVWDEGDYALFYAQGPNGYHLYKTSRNGNGNGTWNENGNENRRIETRRDQSRNFINIYDDYAYYFINFDKGSGKRVQLSNEELEIISTATSTPITRYDDYQYLNEEKFNLMKVGRIWTGDAITGNKTITFTTRSPIRPTDVILYRTRYVAYQSQGNKMSLDMNGLNPATFAVAANAKTEYSPSVYSGTQSNFSGNQLSFNYSPNTGSNPNGQFFFDYAEVQYKEDLKFNNSQMNFRSYGIAEQSGNTYTFSLAEADSVDQVWQVSDITNVVKKVNISGNAAYFNFGYYAGSDLFVNEFVAFKNSEAFAPSFVGRIANQDIASLQNIDYLMITVPDMMSQAQRLAHFYKDQYQVAVVDVDKIYNEFSSGSTDITAIRDFVTRLNTPVGKLKYLFILGDTSYDFKGKNHPGSSVVPSYQSETSADYEHSFVTDDYFAITEAQEESAVTVSAALPNFPVGRLPAANSKEAQLMIDKALAYNNALPGQSTPFGEWRMKLNFVADDDADTGFPFHNTVNNSILMADMENGTITVPPNTPPSTALYENKKPEYHVRKLYLDAFPAETSAGGQRYPQVNQAISNDVGNSLYLFYFGHGGINGWAQERVLTIDQIQNFNNYNTIYSRFPLVSTITCEFTLWDEPGTYSAGEQVIKSKTGGASTMITSSRAIGVGYGQDFTTLFTKHLFHLEYDEFESLGDALLKSKIEYGPKEDHLKVNFLGDPATRLSRPKRLITIDKIDAPVPGQLRALDFVKLTGHLNKTDGTIDDTFNGRVAVNIFDKRLYKKTLNNDHNYGMTPILKYTEEGSPIVKSSGVVKNGVFILEFYVPKDINYEMPIVKGEVEKGRILVYADNFNDKNAPIKYDVFANQPQVIGGINPNEIEDHEAPKVKLYLNNTHFADGGITNQNPLFLACVTDDKGINSTGSGIGHDVTMILDGKIIDTVVLNDFYFSGEGNGCINPALKDYQKGNITYPFRNLAIGEHQLVFKVWDINNNSTTETLNFIVKDEREQHLIVKKLLNWPNPFTNKTYVQFEHNCNAILEVNVQVYTITGKLVKTIHSIVTAEPYLEGFRTPRTAIGWDGKDDFGDAVGKGTYLFKIVARSQNQDQCKGSATAIEKMVLLK